MRPRRLSLFLKIWLSTSVTLTALFAVVGWILQRHVAEATTAGLEQEVSASFQAYEALWRSRSETLASLAAVLSSMPNVRAAFQTGHPETIRDSAGELWGRISDQVKESAFFVVTDPEGRALASLEPGRPLPVPDPWPLPAAVGKRFPQQSSGFAHVGDALFQVVVTPVYIDTPQGSGLISILLTGYTVNDLLAGRLKESTGSEFLFVSGGRTVASTLDEARSRELQRTMDAGPASALVSDGRAEYARLARELISLEGQPVGRLCIFRSFAAARQGIAKLRRNLILMWVIAMAVGLGVTYELARRLVQPILGLDAAAAEIGRQNYAVRVQVDSQDELGRLAATFNDMCASLESARRELIRQERISTIGRMASSIVHDLRNPLAAIYGGAEMMVDTELSTPQVKRVAANIYAASRRIQDMLSDLLQLTRGRAGRPEPCRLREVVLAAVEEMAPAAARQSVRLEADIPEEIELPLERGRMERVFLNLIGNALEAMPEGGEIRIQAEATGDRVEVLVTDTGPGISAEIRGQLFQPFVTHGKKHGLGLGLALSRQSVLDHGGDMWVEDRREGGACFHIRLPLGKPAAVAS